MWDLVVVGGGSAGLVASRTAASLGASVLLVERERLGGECLWTGCVPSKALIETAAAYATVDRRQPPTRDPDETPSQRFRTAIAAAELAIARIEPTDSAPALEGHGVSVQIGDATFTSPTTLDVGRERVAFRQAIVASGSAPAAPVIPGAEQLHVFTNDDIWTLPEPPRRLLILGGGPMGCEIGQAMARLGCSVTLVQRAGRLLPREEVTASRLVHDAMRADGVAIHLGRTVARASSDDGTSGSLVLDDGTEIAFDVVLAAAGREPRTSTLGLQAAGVDVEADGSIAVDRSLRTSNPRIWAAGDVTTLSRHTHSAGVHGSTAAINAVLGLRRSVATTAIPRVTFTSPEVAAVGMQAADAVSGRHRIVTVDHAESDRAIAADDRVGYTRIVVDRRGRILGGSIVGPRAGETLGELATAVSAGLTTSDLAGAMHAYPTHSDALWNAAIEDVRRGVATGASARGIRALARLRSWRLRAPRDEQR